LTFQTLSTPASLAFTHAAQYDARPPRQPLARVEIASTTALGTLAGHPVTTLVLVDSGADMTMLEEALAPVLGIDLQPITPEPVGGIGGTVMARRHPVLMHLCGVWMQVPVLFAPNQRTQLLGRTAVFDRLGILFVHRLNTMLGVAI
jgi:hypothetical protein